MINIFSGEINYLGKEGRNFHVHLLKLGELELSGNFFNVFRTILKKKWLQEPRWPKFFFQEFDHIWISNRWYVVRYPFQVNLAKVEGKLTKLNLVILSNLVFSCQFDICFCQIDLKKVGNYLPMAYGRYEIQNIIWSFY